MAVLKIAALMIFARNDSIDGLILDSSRMAQAPKLRMTRWGWGRLRMTRKRYTKHGKTRRMSLIRSKPSNAV